MPDITMCVNNHCPSREQCYRYTAKPSEYRQSYSAFKPDDSGKCGHFWDNGREGGGDE